MLGKLSACSRLNGKLESIPGGLIFFKTIFANGTAGTYSTDIDQTDGGVYLVVERPINDNNSLVVTPIIFGYCNPQYITIVDGKFAVILNGAWGFANIYKFM